LSAAAAEAAADGGAALFITVRPLAPTSGISTCVSRSPCSVMVRFARNGRASVPARRRPPATKMYCASKLSALPAGGAGSGAPSGARPRSSKASSPCTSTSSSSGGLTSTRMDCPTGTTTLSPAAGGSLSAHVLGALQRSRKEK
jgi:hypothetical protein